MVECIPIFEYLATQDFLFSEMHKSRRNACFQSKNQIKTYIDMVAHVLRENEPDCLHDVLIDSPPVAASEELINLCEDLIEQGSKIEFFEVRPSANDWILQAHDFITGAVGDNVEGIGCKCDLYNMIKDKKRKL